MLVEEWRKLHDDGVSWKQIAEHHNPDGLTWDAIRKRVYRLTPDLPEFSPRIYDDQLVIKTDNAIIASDFEIPDTHPRMAKLILALGQRYHIKHLLIAGDLLATDQAAFSTSHPVTWRESHELTYEQVVQMTQKTLNAYARHFSHIYVLEGNHDDRVGRGIAGEIHIGMLLHKATFSRYHYGYIQTSKGDILVMHPRQFSKNAAGLGQRLYNSADLTPNGHKPKTLILGHTHQTQYAFSEDGLCEIYALGCLRDQKRTKYVSQSATTYPRWNNSLIMLRNGYCYHIGLRSDLQFWLGGHATHIDG